MDPEKIFEQALGITSPWYIAGLRFDPAKEPAKKAAKGPAVQGVGDLHVRIDFEVGSRFAVEGHEGVHPVHDTVNKTYRHMNMFQHHCFFDVRVPRVKLPDGSVRQVTPPWEGKLHGLTLLFEAFVLLLCREMPFAAAARTVGISAHRALAVCDRYVEEAVALRDDSKVRNLTADDTSRAKGHNYITIVADADERRVLFVGEGREGNVIEAFVKNLTAHHGKPSEIENISIDMSPAYISAVEKYFPDAQITFDKFHVIAHASEAIDETRREEQKLDPSLKGMRWVLLKDRKDLSAEQRAQLDALVTQMTGRKTARAWHYREQLRDILTRAQPNVVRRLLQRWIRNVLSSKVEAMKAVARMIQEHFDGVLAWVWSRQTNGFIEALNGVFQAAKRKARGYVTFRTIRTVVFLIGGKLDFTEINPYVGAL